MNQNVSLKKAVDLLLHDFQTLPKNVLVVGQIF